MAERIGAYREMGGAGEASDDPTANLRGREALDRSGERLGEVVGLLIDEQGQRVAFLRLETDPMLAGAARQVLVPVAAVARVEADRVHLDQLRERLFSAPLFEPDRAYPPEYYAGLLDYFGYGPSDIPGVTTPIDRASS